ncbi:hypothetical protein QBZ16_005362 [Prototheca wickerhamii]|uniref:Aminotransferase class V domain-containing protein n=1 Tax=Prototheca wickerhamii TaxID=3111 RepID=A0AAD9II47_PROWI|nr:hypothetical protein QBZ16_005362 [Prototheca wickerhamii]
MAYASDYGYGGRIDALYDEEIGSRMSGGHYLDATGAALYWNSQAKAYAADLTAHVFGNPHSANPPSLLTEARVAEARRGVLALFGVSEETHELVLTRSGTGALNLLADAFPWSANSTFAYTLSNHNSVLGIRSVAGARGAAHGAVSEEGVEAWLAGDAPEPEFLPCADGGAGACKGGAAAQVSDDVSDGASDAPSAPSSLFAFPAKDNYNGQLFPLSWVARAQAKSTSRRTWRVLVDAAAYVPTSPLNLTEVPADFVIMSFYKLFGLPTGVGALIARREAAADLRKTYWGGGAIFLATAALDWHAYRGLPDRLEDGTLPFLDIVALHEGLRTGTRTRCVPTARARLRGLRHANGAALVRLFGRHGDADAARVQGATLTFLLLDPRGEPYSYRAAAAELAAAGVYVRSGCTCNPGSCYGGLGLRDEEIRRLAEAKHHNWTNWEWIQVTRPSPSDPAKTVDVTLPLGALRASLGAMSRYEDVEALAEYLERHYVDRAPDGAAVNAVALAQPDQC